MSVSAPGEAVAQAARRKSNAESKHASNEKQELIPFHVGGGARLLKFPAPDCNAPGKPKKAFHHLNMNREYGVSRNPKNNWDSKAGVRELIQNMIDGAMQARNLRLRDIRVEEMYNGKPITAEDIDAMSSTPPCHLLEIFLYDQKAAASSSGGGKPRPIAYAAWKPSADKPGYGDLELYNVGKITVSAWTMGGSTKKNNPDLIGQYGDGLKIGINALMREGASVLYHTGEKVWLFGYRKNNLAFNKKTSKRIVDGVLVQVYNIPWDSICLDRFLFLRPPTEHISKHGGEWSQGCILLDQRLRSKIYVKGIFIRKEDDDTTGLVYGVNIAGDIAMSRDRSALEDRRAASRAIYAIWEPLILSSADARSRYVDLLLNDERSLDIEGIERHISPNCSKLLLDELRERHGQDTFFFYAQETTEERRIIENNLKKKPFLLTKIFYNALRRHKTILSPEEAHDKAFRALDTFELDENGSPAARHTMHCLRALLQLDPATRRFTNSISFKSGHFEILEISIRDEQVHLSANLLKSEYVHKKQGYSSCLVAQKSSGSSEKPCDCYCLLIANRLTNELRLTQTIKDDLTAQQRILIEQMPRNFLIEDQDIGGHDASWDCRAIRWTTRERIPEEIGFIVAIAEHAFDTAPKANLIHKLDQHPPEEVNDEVEPCNGQPLLVGAKDASLSLGDVELRAGRRHAIQVRIDSKIAIWSVPFSFTVPPATPSGVDIKTLPSGRARVRWNEAAGAASYSLRLMNMDGETIQQLDDLMDCQWEGVVGDDLSTVRLDSFAQDGHKCLVSAEASVNVREPSRGPSPAAPESAADDPMDAHNTSTSRNSSPKFPLASRGLSSRFSPPLSALNSPAPDASPVDGRTPDVDRAIRGTGQSPYRGVPPSPGPVIGAELAMNVQHDDVFDIYAPHSPDDDDTDDDDPVDENKYLNVPAFKLSNPELSRDSKGLGATPVDNVTDENLEFTVGKTYRLLVHGVRQVLRIHEIILDPAERTYIHAVRYLWASDYFKDIYGVHQALDKEELILLIEDPTARVRVGEVDCCRILRSKITVESLEEAEIHVRHDALPTDDLDSAPGTPKTYGCRWALTSSRQTNTVKLMEFSGHPEFDPRLASPEVFDGPKPALAADAMFLDLFAGCGGVARGFDSAGFRILAAVEEQPHAATSWQLNFPDHAIHAESIHAFLSDVEMKKIPSPGRVAVLSLSTSQLAANGGTQQLEDLQHLEVIGRAIDSLRPAYIVMDISSSILNSRYRRQCQTMELDLLSRKYSFTYRYLSPADYGVATDCGRWILIAAVSGLRFPDWPTSTHGDVKNGLKPFVTIRDAIQDLEWRNPRQPANASYEGRSVYCFNVDVNNRIPSSPYAVSLGAGVQDMVTHHTTGLAGTGEKNIPEYDQPCQTLLARRSEGQPCHHPRYPNELLTPRELARIVSFPDSHLFAGPIADQYKQIAGAMPPRLVEAVALQLRKVLLEDYPELVFVSVADEDENRALPAEPVTGEKRPKSEEGGDQVDEGAGRPRKRVKVEEGQ